MKQIEIDATIRNKNKLRDRKKIRSFETKRIKNNETGI